MSEGEGSEGFYVAQSGRRANLPVVLGGIGLIAGLFDEA